MPHFSLTELLRQKSMTPASFEHTQSQASAVWTVNHGLDLPGLPSVLAYDAAGNWMSHTNVQATSENTCIITFSEPVSGSAVVYIQDAYVTDSLLIKTELEVGTVEVTGLNGILRAGGIPVSLEGHGHSFDSITGKPTTLAGYGITDAVVSANSPAFSGVPTAPTAAAGTNTAQIATTAFVRANKAPVLNVEGGLGWKDLTSELVSRGGSSAPALSLFRGNIYAYQFAANSVDQLYSTFHIPHDYAPGTALYIHIHWADASANPTGVVRWGFEYTFAKGHGQEAFPATTTVYVEQAPAGPYKHMVAEISTGVLSTAAEVDGLLLVRIFRDATHANDTSPAAAFAFTCDLHYQADRLATLNRAPNFYA